jgi:hypothetical protein
LPNVCRAARVAARFATAAALVASSGTWRVGFWNPKSPRMLAELPSWFSTSLFSAVRTAFPFATAAFCAAVAS